MRGVGRLLKIIGSAFGLDVIVRNSLTEKTVLFDLHLLSCYWNNDKLVQLYENSMNATGMGWSDNFAKRCRFFSIAQIVEYVLAQTQDGDVAECGCWRGHSSHMISTILTEHGFNGNFHIFDSFEGLSELLPEDKNERYTLSQDQIAKQAAQFACAEETVRANLAAFPFIKTYKGWIPSRFDEVADRQFRLVHVDVDLYQPYQDAINFFYPRLVSGGAMVFDDYGLTQFPGAKLAVDEAVASLKPKFFFQVPTGGAFLIKD